MYILLGKPDVTARILIVDDVPANIRLLGAQLAAEYYQLRTAANGAEAIEAAQMWQPDLILLDIMMPEMDGFECCRLLKEAPGTAHIPIIIITTLGEAWERTQGLEVGADDFLTKPVDYDTLMARVRSLVRLKRLLDEWRMRSDTAQTLGLQGNSQVAPAINGARALVVDDWKETAINIQSMVKAEGLTPVCVESATEAVKVARTVKFDLVIVNFSLADGDPLHLIGFLRALDATRDTPLLIIGESGGKARILRAFDLGANDWVIQPIEPSELRVRIRNLVRRKIYQDRLRTDVSVAFQLALTDPLTALYNQRYIRHHLGTLLESREESSLALLMIDVDHFKSINDRFGHGVGDLVLQEIAACLRQNTRAFDLVGRYGGEEFIIVMPGAAPDEAMLAAERLRREVANLAFEQQKLASIAVTISIGVAHLHGLGRRPDDLIACADAALYRAKEFGRNRVEREGKRG